MKKFDYEYSTQYVKEMKYLDTIGIKYIIKAVEYIWSFLFFNGNNGLF